MPSQLGLLYESVLSGKPSLNVLQVVVRFRDEGLDMSAMEQAWRELAERYDVLRSTLEPLSPEGPRQCFWPKVETQISREDWSGHGGEFETALTDWLEADRRAGLDVERAPAWRVAALEGGSEQGAMVWTFHHAMLDGNGYRVLLEDFFDLYDGRRSGRALSPVSQEGPGFADHVSAVAALDHTKALAYYEWLLDGFDGPNELAPAFARGVSNEVDAQERRTLSSRLKTSQSLALHERAQRVGVSASAMISAAWGLVLARCSGRDEAVFGMTRSGRHLLPEGRRIAGCQINTLPMRVRLKDQTLDGLLRQLRADMVATRPHEHVPLNAIIERCDLPSGQALFDTIVLFDRGSLPEQMKGVGGERRQVDEYSQMATMLTLSAYDDPAMLLRLEYDPGRLSDEGAGRLFEYFVRLLSVMIDAEDVPLGALCMLADGEVARLRARAGGDASSLDTRGVIDRFEAVVRAHPHWTALEAVGGEETLSYAGLDARANHLAFCLREQGVGPGDIVGLALPRGPEFVAAMLGVLKAQAAFLPLDPDFPTAALDDMLGRAKVAALFAERRQAERLSAGAIPVLRVDDRSLDGLSISPPPRAPLDPESPAYVIYTSGSTGKPKGVVLPHRAFTHHASAMIRAFGLTPEDRVLQFASLNFDVSIEEIVPTLLAGARLVLRDNATAQSVPHLLNTLQAHRISVANLPTAFWHVLVADLAEAPRVVPLPDSLRLMIVGGERVSGEALSRWLQMYPDLRWLNGYGPTEAAVTATLYDTDAPAYDGGEVPIGAPVAHVRAEIRTPEGSLAPDGVAGELWLSGPGLALGYLGMPEQTAEVFVSTLGVDPVPSYRTGDKAAWREDGALAYLGRIDRQIKLRGYRIELGAIEAALEADPAVMLAAVGLDRPGSDQARLLAWVRFIDTEDIAALTARVGEALPGYMLPQLVPVTDFPRKPSGKIDIARLPRPDRGAEGDALADVAPADAETAKVQAIFAGLLGHKRVGPDESFFDLGGHSLLSVRLMSLLERDFGRRLPLATLFQGPTPRQIAAELTGSRPDGGVVNCLVSIQPEGHLPPLYAIHILGEQGAFFRPLGEMLRPDQPVIGLTLDLLEAEAPTTLPDIAAIYRANIDRHQPQGPIRLIAVSQGAYIAYELAQQLIAAGREVSMVFMLDASGPGGRPRRGRRKGIRHYASRLIRDFPGIVRHRVARWQDEASFHVEKFRLRFARHRLTPNLPLVKSNVAAHQAAIDLAISAYQPETYPGHITVFRATGEELDTPEGIASALGWRVVVGDRVQLIETGGTHLSMLHEPYVSELAQHLRPLLYLGSPQ
ncbi:non-ribosomal peptide synthetase [Pararhodobacter sp. CCB-MM2]|uniref:non-ribosomal peptide synthetase n=1 Tax=Pararhodobacter sp. CCB-MM2 TaxID=1786003 RepID=UPI00082FDCC0|nr:non-ribosomal peptide synthetase [Pararhodobacter sp. CCB-MM2]